MTRTARLLLLLVLPLFPPASGATAAQQRPLPHVDTFVAQVKERLRTDAELQWGYAYTEREVERTLDGSGRVTDEKVRVFEIHPALPGEREPYRRLVEEDGEPVSAEDLARRDRERRQKAEESARRAAAQSEADRRRAWREYEEALAERAETIEDIFNVFEVRMLGREQVNGHQTIVFSLVPHEGAEPRTDDGEMMRHFKARVWISESDHELVRLDAEAVDDVSWGFGLLARLHKGMTASFERRKVNGEAWLPAKMTYEGSGRVLLVRRVRRAGESVFSNYRRSSADTTTALSEREAER